MKFFWNLLINQASYEVKETYGLIIESEIKNKQINFDETAIDVEIDEAINHVDDLTFTYKVNDYEQAINEENDDLIELEINDSSLYKSNQIDELNLQIGGNEIIRFSCACHKLNVSIRHAINLHDDFKLLLATLNKSSSHIRNTIKLNKV